MAAALVLAAAACERRPHAFLIADPTPVFRGHQDLDAASSPPVPRVFGRTGSISFCLDAPPGKDTSQWEARWGDGPFAAPAVRIDTTVCFEARVPANQKTGPGELCAELRDRFDGTVQALPCLPFRLDDDDKAILELEKEIPAALSAPRDAEGGGPVARLSALRDEARDKGFPALSLRFDLIAAYTLRREGSESSRVQAALLLRDDPSWIGLPAAARWAGQMAYERATLALDAKADLAGCWALLRAAERAFRSCGDRKWIAVVSKQAEVLSRAGASAEAKDRLRFALAACASAPCDASLVRAAENTLAWLVASDPDASEAELSAADRSLTALLAENDASDGPLERANLGLNLAIVRQRRGLACDAQLKLARDLIGRPSTARGRELAGWADLVEGRRALAESRPAAAAAIGDRLGAAGESARLRAFGASCAGAAYRRLHALDRARDRFARALTLHAQSGADALGQDVPLGPGQRAEDAYAAARVELDDGRPQAAWSILRELDDEAGPTAAPASLDLAPWLAALADLETPSSDSRREQREAIRRNTLDRMQELLRARREATVFHSDDAGVEFRAFPLDDEIVVLRRMPTGTIVSYRRTPMARSTLVTRVGAVHDAMERAEPDDARWRDLVAPLGRALAPRPEDLGAATTFAMHGILQEVPLTALPVGSESDRRWLGEVTAVLRHAESVAAAHGETGPPSGAAVFVEDPRGDLGLGEQDPYPAGAGLDTRVLSGDEATRDAVHAALDHASWLHVDAHVQYEPAFPELSRILLAGGAVTGQELAAWASGLKLANVSGCESGRSAVTAGSGRFGLSGLLARSGVPWVIGTRAPLGNALAIAFNRAFYLRLAAGDTAPEAYRLALDGVRGKHPASRWAVLVLLHAHSPNSRGQSAHPRTPSPVGGVR